MTHIKVAKIVLSGSQNIPSPMAFTEGLFLFMRYFSEKKGYLNYL